MLVRIVGRLAFCRLWHKKWSGNQEPIGAVWPRGGVDSAVGAFAWDKATRALRDTCYAPLSDTGSLKVVAYYNAKGCTACRLKELYQWNEARTEFDSIARLATGRGIEVVLVFGVGRDKTKLQEVESSLLVNRIRFPVLIDTLGAFEAGNLLPSEEAYHYFLLDRHNRILVVGALRCPTAR